VASTSATLLASPSTSPARSEIEQSCREFIDQITFTRRPEYVFHHPLIRTVAYESQLKWDRAELHRRLAAAIQQREPDSGDGNAALIAEYLETAGDLHAAYGWHMRAGAWSRVRDVSEARVS
jgi:adenylate cyclase